MTEGGNGREVATEDRHLPRPKSPVASDGLLLFLFFSFCLVRLLSVWVVRLRAVGSSPSPASSGPQAHPFRLPFKGRRACPTAGLS